jgi:hypothetical protein
MEKIKFKNNTLNTVIVPDRFTLKGYSVEAIYVHNPVANAPCSGGHTCDRARFNVLINNVVVLEANLNNKTENSDGTERPDHPIAPPAPLMSDGIGSDPMDRYSINIISESMANEIANNDPLNYTINIFPHPTNTDPHTDITWVRIKDPEENIVYSSCSAAGQAVSVTEAILASLGAIKRLECLDKVVLEFDITDMTPSSEYAIKYRVLDIQSLNTIPLNEKTYIFSNPCCSNRIGTEYLNGFMITPTSRNLSCQVEMSLRCTQSALIEISLLKNNTTISRDIAQIICPVCRLETSFNQPIIDNPVLKNINKNFTIRFNNLSSLGTQINQSTAFGNSEDVPIIIQNNTKYLDTPISLLADNLTLNGYYEYKFHMIPNNSPINIEPLSDRFFAGSSQQIVTAMFNMTSNQISILYASLKDLETGIVRNSSLIYLVNINNCTELPKNIELVEYPQNISTESGLELGEECDLTKLAGGCILQ